MSCAVAFQCLCFPYTDSTIFQNVKPLAFINMTVQLGLCQTWLEPKLFLHLSHHMGKPTICIGENKGTDQLCSNCEADQRLCFRYTVQSIFFLNPKCQVSGLLLLLYSWVCVRPGPEAIKLFFMLILVETRIYPAHKC